MTSIWKFHADRLRKATKEYVEAVHGLVQAQIDGKATCASVAALAAISGKVDKAVSAERAVEVALALCDVQDEVDARGRGDKR